MFNIWGQVRDVVEIEFSEVRRVLQVEFFDERAAAHFKADMNNQVYQVRALFMKCGLGC